LRRDAARQRDLETQRDRYEEADAALYEAIRLLKLRQDNAAERKAELARRAQQTMGRNAVLGELDEKHQDPSVAEPSLPPKHPSMASRFMSGVAGLNPFQRG